MAQTRAEIQRRWRERKRQGLVVPRDRAPTKAEEIGRLNREVVRRQAVEALEVLARRMRHPEDRGAVFDLIEEVKGW